MAVFARRSGRVFSAALAAAVLLSAAGPARAFSATFSWRGIPACGTVSPAFVLKGVPKGTTALNLQMRDRDAPDFQHGGATVPYGGHGTVARGAVAYTGPCPPKGARHHYIWTLDALDAKGADLDMTEAGGDFPPR